jgi:DNA-binding XRE family transcriptional regulator
MQQVLLCSADITTVGGGLPRRLLAVWRKDHGLSQMKLAAAIGVTLATIANIEQARDEPSLSTAQKIADALDLDLDQVIWPLAHVATPYPSKVNRRIRPEARGT